MKAILNLITLLALCQIVLGQETDNSTAPINNGFVFIDGKYIEPPYNIYLKDSSIFINDIFITKLTPRPFYKEYLFDHDPGIPPEISKNSSFDDFVNMKEPTRNMSYWMALQGYYYSHFYYDEAKEKVLSYLRNLPNIKNITIDKTKGFIIETYIGEKHDMFFGSIMPTFNQMWGPDGERERSENYHLQVDNAINKYQTILENNDILFVFSNKNTFSISNGIETITTIEDIVMNDSISIDKKVELLGNKGLSKNENALVFIKNYNMSAKQHYYNSLSYCLSLYSVNISFNDRYLLQD
mgnify:CR=1 FL=1